MRESEEMRIENLIYYLRRAMFIGNAVRHTRRGWPYFSIARARAFDFRFFIRSLRLAPTSKQHAVRTSDIAGGARHQFDSLPVVVSGAHPKARRVPRAPRAQDPQHVTESDTARAHEPADVHVALLPRT